ncbi:MAG: cytochrome c1 [bacterium]
MKKLISILALALLPVAGFTAGGPSVELKQANINLADKEALQRGAKYFVNYCMGCHSAQYFRYEGMKEFGLSDTDIRENLITTGANVGDQMRIAMDGASAAEWFGAPPPDLTLTARLKPNGGDWLYTYLHSFYLDESRPLGFNNTVFPNVGMPHVLWELQGVQKAVMKEVAHEDGHTEIVVDRLEVTEPGTLSAEEYDRLVKDLVTFMVHIAEPMKLERQRLGVWVLLFLSVFFVLAYMLKKEYWKDVH